MSYYDFETDFKYNEVYVAIIINKVGDRPWLSITLVREAKLRLILVI